MDIIKNQHSHTSTGFTIVELLIVLVVVGILTLISTVTFSGFRDRADTAVLVSGLRQAALTIETSTAESGQYPDTVYDMLDFSNIVFQYNSDGDSYCLTAVHESERIDPYFISSNSSADMGVCEGSVIVRGGEVSQSDGFTYHVFNSSADLRVFGQGELEYLVVGGGGGGGNTGNNIGTGGGGGGGLQTGVEAFIQGVYPVIVGVGGSSTSGDGANGTSSALGNIEALGGGGGGRPHGSGRAGASGGGGGGGNNTNNHNNGGGSGVDGQGFGGGRGGVPGQSDLRRGGGGGGAGGIGLDASPDGSGGLGLEVTAFYQFGDGGFFASGGAGFRGGSTAYPGGGAGGYGGDGLPNTGGGGAGNYGTGGAGGSGGSGVVIIRY